MRAFHRCFLPSFSSFGWGVLEAYLSVIQFIANCILPISIFKLELSPFPQKNRFFYKAYNHKHELPVAAIFVNGSGRNEQSLQRIFHRCFLPSFSSFGPVVSEEKIKMWKINRRRTPSDGKSSHCLWQGELKTNNECKKMTRKARFTLRMLIWQNADSWNIFLDKFCL